MIQSYLHEFFFGYFPYLCLSVCLVATIIRYDREQYTWKADSSMLLRSRGMVIASNLFHVGILFLFLGHAVGLLTPHAVYEPFISAPQKAFLAMTAGGIAGIVCLLGMSWLLYRRLFDPRIRATSKPMDTVVLVLLYLQLLLGLGTIPFSARSPDGSSMMALANWAQYILTFRSGAADLIVHEPWVFKTHIVLGLLIIGLFPFTRLVHMLSGLTAPVRYLIRSGFQIARKRG
ncbi:respiratory nitrate reductase subunit gamma [Phaeovibrio sulfidiphilus]|uniref:nitrate reductase (quinone) n=1 Tax=Phaeovibrio sulfidiphilus TaxID=1220600 RepID=A0A8J6YME6_9PROT|nr:respiratory nitrate reductase subunit gamma [Phaeovibrio sulfidiphilus]MBE1237378.1 respiratory nitrate reductase subunit gamma [Phaeovibrio sulfidiphilus]